MQLTNNERINLRYFIELSYNGKAYHGWQYQPNAQSVQDVLESCLSTLLKKEISIVGAGRTDTGVHAKQMFAHFDSEEKIDQIDLLYKLNSFLPKDIAIAKIHEVNDDAHARFSAESRSYLYRISREKDAFNFDYAYSFKQALDLKAMKDCCDLLLNHKNFKCFSRSNTDVKTYNCNVMLAEWVQMDNELHFRIKADRFLRNMVRAVVGTLLEVGQGKMTINEFKAVLDSKDRTKAGPSAPAHGLYLTEVEYPQSIFINE